MDRGFELSHPPVGPLLVPVSARQGETFAQPVRTDPRPLNVFACTVDRLAEPEAAKKHRCPSAARYACLLVLLLLLVPSLHAGVTLQSLDGVWQGRLSPGSPGAASHPEAMVWFKAQVPGVVQTDLLANNLIGKPFYRNNVARLQWIGRSNWEYRTTFPVDKATFERDHIDLVFKGLDTFAKVTLNGQPILSADNMFREWRVPVKPLLHVGENTLIVQFDSPIGHVLPWLQKQPYKLPKKYGQTANYVRKAAYQYGWDWAPTLVTEGIWKPVSLESWNTLRLADLYIAQPHVTAQAADVSAQFDVHADRAGNALLRVDWAAPDHTQGSQTSRVTLKAGENTFTVPVTIPHPQRWWPNGYGKQNMYQFRGEVLIHGKVLASVTRDTGLRSVELRRQKDKWGRSFEFVVNGVPIFAKGSNWVPPDSFPTRVTKQHIHDLLASARAANMNMLRVWGGGYYPSDAFYTMADRMGLMIWQDFMFGGAIPPAYDKAFVENTKQEAIEQVKRLRNHPSLVLWCGENEVSSYWIDVRSHDDAFLRTVTVADVERITEGLHNLFGVTLRNVVGTYEPSVPYWPESSSFDKVPSDVPDNQLPGDGDFHDYPHASPTVGKYGDFRDYPWAPGLTGRFLSVTPRFESEYGLQSFPDMATIDRFTTPADRTSLESAVMQAHQRSKGATQLTLNDVRIVYGAPKSFADAVYLTQVMQAEGIEFNAEHLRASRPHSMGSLYWMLDDAWPGTTWSSIDYYGNWKMLQYHAKRFYAPVRIIPIRGDSSTDLNVVSDQQQPFDATVRIRVLNMDGKLVDRQQRNVHVAALASTPVGTFTDTELLHGADRNHTVAVFDLMEDGKLLSRHFLFFTRPKNLKLPDPGLHAELSADGHHLSVTTQRFASEVWITFGQQQAVLSDNAFDLLPGESRTLTVTSDASAAELRQAIEFRSLYGATLEPGPESKYCLGDPWNTLISPPKSEQNCPVQ